MKQQHVIRTLAIVVTIVALFLPSNSITQARNKKWAAIGFTQHIVTDNFDGALSVYATDLDSDGDTDLLGAAYFANMIAWWENDGNESFTQHIIDNAIVNPYAAFPVDLDSDGDMDALVAGRQSRLVIWYENDGSENFTGHVIDATLGYVATVYAVDLDHDDDVDVIAGDADAYDPDKIAWYENNGSEIFTRHILDDNFDAVWCVYADDINKDGNIDILATAGDIDTIAWWENDGNRNFTKRVIDSGFDDVRSAYPVDLDSDGDIDIVASAFAADEVVWWKNDGSENFTKQAIAGDVDGAYSVHAADLDNDGDVDVLAAATDGHWIAWWENDGSEGFTSKHTIIENFERAYFVNAPDIDDDGDQDVLAAAHFGDTIAWWENSMSLADTIPPGAITSLIATSDTYPGDIHLSWTAPGDDGNTGAASLYEIRYASTPILSESEWNNAFEIDGEPLPLIAGSNQTMAVSLIPGHIFHFAIKAQDEALNASDLSNSVSAKASGYLVSDINWRLKNDPSSILNQKVTVLVTPISTFDGPAIHALLSLPFAMHHIIGAETLKGIGLNALYELFLFIGADKIMHPLTAQWLWGLNAYEYGQDLTLLVKDTPIMDIGVPYVITGYIRKETNGDDYFYYLPKFRPK